MKRGALAVAALAATAWADLAAADTFRGVYDVFLGGLRGGELSLTVKRDGPRYEATAEMKSAGLAAWIFPGKAEARARGGLTGPVAPTPARFDAEGAFAGKPQVVSMTFDPARPLRLEADPPLRKRSYEADLSKLGGALDPLSAAVAVLAPAPVGAVCGRTISVFDSRRQFDLNLGAETRDGDLIRCEGEFRRVAGFKDKHLRQPPHPFTAWWRVEDGQAVFERAQAPTNFGHAVARRRS
jgi:hypothetical protein